MPLPQRLHQQPVHKPQPARLRVRRILPDVLRHVRVLVVVDPHAGVAGARGEIFYEGGLPGGGGALYCVRLCMYIYVCVSELLFCCDKYCVCVFQKIN